MFKRVHPKTLALIEAGLIGLFFIQAVRFLIGMLYSRVAGASVAAAVDPALLPANTIDPAVVSSEVSFVVYALALPLLTLLLGRARVMLVVAAVIVAVGRALITAGTPVTPVTAAGLVLGGGLMYLAVLVRYRAQMLPYLFVLGLGADQLLRAAGNTLDPSALSAYHDVQVLLSVIAIAVSVLGFWWEGRREVDEVGIQPDHGLLPFWGGIGLGGLLFLELALLAVPNAVAGRADVDYTTFVPWVMLATLLPLIPFVREQARVFLGLFDGNVRGWLWMLVIALLIVAGTRFQGIGAGIVLVVAQFGVSLMWWWLVRPRSDRDRSFNGLWLILAVAVFALLLVMDNFTYEYAFVRDFTGSLSFLNNSIPPLLRGFRGMGLTVLLFAVFLAALPMTQTRRRIPWANASRLLSFTALIVTAAASVGAAYIARPPVISGVRGPESIRIGTYNIHAGYDEFYAYDLEAIARAIQQSGANVILLQEAESGRLTSFGVDQPLWLARRLGMDRRFFPTNEGLQGLAVLSNVEIAYDDGNLLTSLAQQTGVQRVQLQPETGTVITVYNTWLGYLLEAESADLSIEQQEQDQQRQINEIFAIIASHHAGGILGRTVVGGTFNNVPDSPLLDQMRAAGFADPFAGLPLELSATFARTGYPRARLDYLWVRNMLPVGALVMDSSASDHRLAVTEVLINR